MKTIGLIGGMSWESTITYYEILNKEIVKALGGFHSAKIMMYNVDFAELEANMSSGNWDGNAKILSDAAKRLEGAGADGFQPVWQIDGLECRAVPERELSDG